MTARSVAQIVCGGVAVVWAAYVIWFSVTGLQDDPPDAWFYVVALALVPVGVGFAVQLPDLIAPRTENGRTDALFAPLPAACFSVGLFVSTIALAVAIDSAAWSVAVVTGGVVLALENFSSMRTARRVLARSPDEPRPPADPPTVREIAGYAARMMLFLIALVVVLGSVGYVLFGRAGMLVSLGLTAVGVAWSFVSVTRRMRQGRVA